MSPGNDGRQLKTDSSRHWHVGGQPRPTTVLVRRATQSGAPVKVSSPWEACALCFTNSSGREAPAIVSGVCSNCGFVHNGQEFDADANVTSEKPTPRPPRVRRRRR